MTAKFTKNEKIKYTSGEVDTTKERRHVMDFGSIISVQKCSVF
jgi:hypothetical protein